jgi:hypothetical protein
MMVPSGHQKDNSGIEIVSIDPVNYPSCMSVVE